MRVGQQQQQQQQQTDHQQQPLQHPPQQPLQLQPQPQHLIIQQPVHQPQMSNRNPYLSETNLYIEGIPREWIDIDLQNHFQSYGEISAVRILVHKETNASREVGFIHFVRREDACRAMAEWQEKKPFPTAERAFKIKFANKGKKDDHRRLTEIPSKFQHNFQPHQSFDYQPMQYQTYDNNGAGYGRNPKFNEICRYFQRGNCRRGQNCFYRHESHEQSQSIAYYHQPHPQQHYNYYDQQMIHGRPHAMYAAPAAYYDPYSTITTAAIPSTAYAQLHSTIDPSVYYHNYYEYPTTAVTPATVQPTAVIRSGMSVDMGSNPYAEAWENYYAHKYGVQAVDGVQGQVQTQVQNTSVVVGNEQGQIDGGGKVSEVGAVQISNIVQESVKSEVEKVSNVKGVVGYGPSHGTARQQSSEVTSISPYEPLSGQH